MSLFIRTSLAILFLGLAPACTAQEFRTLQPIPSPRQEQAWLRDAGLKPLAKPVPIPRELVEQAMKRLSEGWNGPGMGKSLAADFPDKDRLHDALGRHAPLDARLHLVSVGTWRVLAQGVRQEQGTELLVSRLAVVARTQVEFTDRDGVFQRRPGEQEYQITVSLKVDRK